MNSKRIQVGDRVRKPDTLHRDRINFGTVKSVTKYKALVYFEKTGKTSWCSITNLEKT